MENRFIRNALTRPPRTPRPLPTGEPLSAEDYRRLVDVIEAVDHACDLLQFRERVVHALQDWVSPCANRQISARLFIGVHTVKKHLVNTV